MRLSIPKIIYLIIICFFLVLVFQVNGVKERIERFKHIIVWKTYKILDRFDKNPNPEYTMVEFKIASTIDRPLMIKGSSLYPNQIFLAEQSGILRKIDTINHTSQIILRISETVRKNPYAGFYNFDFHPKDSILAVSYTSKDYQGKYLQNFDLVPIKNKWLRYDLRKKLYKLQFKGHFGGGLAFDSLGHLFITTSDFSFGDEENYCQELNNLYGKVLRVNIQNLAASIPTDNPFYKKAYVKKEIWAYGFRNPFRICFFNDEKKIIVADVGHEKMEEIDIVEAGNNYGWSIREGSLEHKKIKPESVLIDPVYEYKHGLEGFSVTGGIVYKGSKYPELKNKYIFSDYIIGKVWSLDLAVNKPKPKEILKNAYGITSFYETGNGDILWTDYSKNKVYKLVKL